MTQLNVNDWPLVNLFDGQPDYFLGYSNAQGPMRVAMSRAAAELAAGLALPGTCVDVCIFGDSIGRFNHRTINPTSVSWANGLATWTTTSHGFITGLPLYISGVTSTLFGFAGRTQCLRVNSATEFVTPVPAGVSAPTGTNVTASGLNVADESSLVDNWFMWANAYSGGRFNLVRNASLGGERLFNVSYPKGPLERIDDEFDGIDAQICFISHGTNDCNDATASARSVFEIYQRLLACAQKILLRHRMLPVILTVPPVGSGLANFSVVQNRINALNSLIKNGAGMRNGYVCVDASQYITNWNGGAAYATPPVLVSDNVHLSKIGGRCYGKAIADRFGKSTAPDMLSVSSIDSYATDEQTNNLIDNGIWATSGGSVAGTGHSGTLPTGWLLARLDAGTLSTCVASVVDRTPANDGDSNGKNIRLVMTAAAEAYNPWIRCADAIHSRLVVGGEYEIRVPIKFTNLLGSKLRGLSIWTQLNFVDPASGFSAAYNHIACNYSSTGENMDIASVIGNLPSVDGTFMFRSLPLKITAPLGASGNQFNVRFLFNGTAGSALTVEFGRPMYVRVK